MRYFCSLTEKITAANRVSDDGDRIQMYVNTPTEINGSQKTAFANLTSFVYMSTQSKAQTMDSNKSSTRVSCKHIEEGVRQRKPRFKYLVNQVLV